MNNGLVGEQELAQYFLTILNLSDEYKNWLKLYHNEDESTSADCKAECSAGSEMDVKRRKQYSTDHTQVLVLSNYSIEFACIFHIQYYIFFMFELHVGFSRSSLIGGYKFWKNLTCEN